MNHNNANLLCAHIFSLINADISVNFNGIPAVFYKVNEGRTKAALTNWSSLVHRYKKKYFWNGKNFWHRILSDFFYTETEISTLIHIFFLIRWVCIMIILCYFRLILYKIYDFGLTDFPTYPLTEGKKISFS